MWTILKTKRFCQTYVQWRLQVLVRGTKLHETFVTQKLTRNENNTVNKIDVGATDLPQLNANACRAYVFGEATAQSCCQNSCSCTNSDSNFVRLPLQTHRPYMHLHLAVVDQSRLHQSCSLYYFHFVSIFV